MWQLKNSFAVGGLQNVGYAPTQDLLIVLSSQGQGIFNCKTGEKIARWYDDEDWWTKFDENKNSIIGFGILEGIEISTCGLFGDDDLSKTTPDGWALIASEAEPDHEPFENYLRRRLYLVTPDKKEKILVGQDAPCELRAFGFSSTGESFIIALSCELNIYSRA